jgi:hypothetical protein
MRPSFVATAIVASTAIAAPIEDRGSIDFAEVRGVLDWVNGLRQSVDNINRFATDGRNKYYSSQLKFGVSLTKLQDASSQANSAINYINKVLSNSIGGDYFAPETQVAGSRTN